MTTPSNPPDEGAQSTPAQPPAEPAETAAPTEAIAPVEAAAPAQGAPPPGDPAGYQYPFAPVYRAPRTPWVNPARRGHVVAAAVVGALVFGGGGLLIGHAVSDHGDRHSERHGVVLIGPDEGMNGPGFERGQRPRKQMRPGQRGPRGPQDPNKQAPSTAPSSTPTK